MNFAGSKLYLTMVGLAVCTMLSPPAFGQLTCVGPGIGIPTRPFVRSGPPHWWDNNPAQPDYYQNLDDPRWQGAGSITWGNGTNNIIEWRGLQDNMHIFLSWRMSHVALGTNNNNILYFGLPRSATDGGGTLIVQVNLKRNDTAGFKARASNDPGTYFELKTFTRRTAAGPMEEAIGTGQLSSPPAWLTDTLRVWGNWTNRNELNTWGVQVRVPRANVAITGGQTFKLWFELINATTGNPVIGNMTWPRTGASISQTPITHPVPFDNIYPDPAGWQDFRFSTGPSDRACASAGVSLSQSRIGTTYPGSTSNNNLAYAMSGAPGPQHLNTLFAQPKNNAFGPGPAFAPRDIMPGEIVARFRVANWGSNPNGWEAGVNVDKLWSTIPGGGSVPNSSTILAGTEATAANDIRFNWTVKDEVDAVGNPIPNEQYLTEFRNGTRLPHNCILVELTSPGVIPGTPGLTFVNSSVWNNFNFKAASSFTELAEISIKTLPPIAPDGRDVYIWVETLNMPKAVGADYKVPNLRTTVTRRKIATTAPGGGGAIVEEQAIPMPNLEGLIQLVNSGQVTDSQLQEVVPTYIVHVYHDSGRTLRLGGTDRPVLTPQSAYGYYVIHSGPLFGWEHSLVGDGFALEQLAPDFYRINKVPNEGVVRVRTTVTAHDAAPPPWRLMILIFVLIILLLLILWYRRRHSAP